VAEEYVLRSSEDHTGIAASDVGEGRQETCDPTPHSESLKLRDGIEASGVCIFQRTIQRTLRADHSPSSRLLRGNPLVIRRRSVESGLLKEHCSTRLATFHTQDVAGSIPV